MSDFLGSLWWLLVAIGVLVTFHEFGHYWVARRAGVRVLRFSVGFGKPLVSRRDRHGTEWALAAIPLGGYVTMLDEREGEVPADQRHLAFNNASVWRRIAIVAAGPLANLLLAIALVWAMLVIGRPDYAPVVGHAQGLAGEAGIHPGDTLLSVDGTPTPTWTEAANALMIAALDRRAVQLDLRNADGEAEVRTLALDRLPQQFEELRALELTGLVPRFQLVPPVIGEVQPGMPAAGVLQAGDRVTAIDASPVASYEDIGPLVQALGRRGGEGMVEVQRDGERLALPLSPQRVQETGQQPRWVLGITSARTNAPPAHDAVLRLAPLAAVPAAFRETWTLTANSVGMLWRMVTGRISTQNVSGPITIARFANATAQRGPAWFLNFLALLSVSLAIINLLPVPMLDGGHLMYYLAELATGRPPGERAMAIGQYVGLAFLAGLMGLAFYNDIALLLR